MAHAYVVAGDTEQGRETARSFAAKEFSLAHDHADYLELSYGQLSVEEARRIGELASSAAVEGEHRVLVIMAERFFHEAQNAFLKLFEEPPRGVTLILVVPSMGMLLPTLRSRLTILAADNHAREPHPFVHATSAERAKLVEKLLMRSRSNSDDEKQAARAEAIRLIEDLTIATYAGMEEGSERALFASDLARFTPILHERSAPLKMILEHVLITAPKL